MCFRRHSRFTAALASVMLLASGAWAQPMQPQPGQPLAPQVGSVRLLPPAGQMPAGQPQQSAPPMSTVENPPAQAAPSGESSNPGLIEEFGKLFRKSASGLTSTWQGSQQTLDAINSGAQGAVNSATDALISGTMQTMVKGRAVCPLAGNGAPDCKAASEMLCRTKGYKSGTSVDIETAETCNPKIYISGRTGAPGECKTQNFVTRAVCQ